LKEEFVDKYKDDEPYYQSLLKRIDIEFIPVDDIQQATGEADIIITATPSKKPIIKQEWVKPGTHITCVGADMEGKQEIDERLFAGSRVFVDDITQAVDVGETEIPVKKGILKKEDIICEIGSVIQGVTEGRLSDDEITIYDSTGIALQDLMTAKYILDRAIAENIGVIAEL
jgi:alanine dehydrogenase